jgi:hypothetical protein
MQQRTEIPMMIGLTHTDCEGAWEPEDIALAIGLLDETSRPQLAIVNANESKSVAQCLLVLIEQLMSTAIPH